jgi:hypothetical protein
MCGLCLCSRPCKHDQVRKQRAMQEFDFDIDSFKYYALQLVNVSTLKVVVVVCDVT